MVLDVRAMEWAAQQGLDTAALKKAGVKVYGKWYFPDIPANVPLINLQTGEREAFQGERRAGQVLYVEEAELKRAGLGPFKTEAAAPAVAAPAPTQAPLSGPPPPPEPAEPVAAVPVGGPPSAAPVAEHHPAPILHGGAAAAVRHVPPVYHHPLPEHHTGGVPVYLKVAVILTVLTALEVAILYITPLRPVMVPLLLALSAVKFGIVAGYYMHLRFDNKLYFALFGFGLLIAGAIVAGLIPLGADHIVPLRQGVQGGR